MKRLFVLLLLATLSGGCQKQEDASAPPPQQREATAVAPLPAPGKKLFSDPIAAQRVELPGGAIPYWRDAAAGSRPALVLLSLHPLLQPLSEQQHDDVAGLVASGTPGDFIARGSFFRTDPAFVSTQTLSAALAGNLFSRVIWVFPSTTPVEQLSEGVFRRQLVEAGILSEAESSGLVYQDGRFSGTLRGIPFMAVHPLALPSLNEPAILHLDLGYFKGHYKSEIKTPLYPLLLETARTLKEPDWQVRGATLSFSTEEGEFSLETRFLVNRFAELLADPALLDRSLPENWGLHSEALYTVNFFMEDKVTELYERAAQLAPGDPAVLYGLALRRLRDKDLQGGLELLERSAARDRGYALEFFNLADRAAEAGDFANASMLLDRGRPHFPHNPFIDLQRANILRKLGKADEARALLEELRKLPWSPAIHGEMPQVLEGLLAAGSGAGQHDQGMHGGEQ